MIRTPLTTALRTRVPILAAPLGRGSTPAFLCSVADAGALAFLALRHIPVSDVEAELNRYVSVTDGRFGVNLTLLDDQRQQLHMALAAGVRAISLWQGDIEPYVEIAKAAGATVFWTVGCASDAQRAADLGVDFIVAQGRESGGHLVGAAPTMSLLPAIVDAANGVPVVAAGGIADGRGLAAALALGACGAWMGTRFVASVETASHAGHKERIVSANGGDTVETKLFDIGWPDSPHRVLRNSTYLTWEAAGRPAVGARPGEGDLISYFPDGTPLVRYDDAAPWASLAGDWEAMALYAGSSSQLIRAVEPVRSIIDDIAMTAAQALHRASECFLAADDT